MTRGEITIDEDVCKGCGYCALFCRRSCISISGDRFTPQGYFLPLFSSPELCNACGICGWMCPHFAIQVYKMPEASHEIKTIKSEISE